MAACRRAASHGHGGVGYAHCVKPDGVNYLNSALMLLSLWAAFVLPFELFLFSYAVLGPLHYLTEISWLSDRGFFTQRKHDWVPLVAICVVLLLGQQAVLGDLHVRPIAKVNADLGLAALGVGLILALLKSWRSRAVAALALLVLVVLLHGAPATVLIFGMYLPTIVHVCLFTGAFILFGALKARSASGYLSLAIFIGCIAVVLGVTPEAVQPASEPVVKTYKSFAVLNAAIARTLGAPFSGYADVFTSAMGVRVMRFIAFAYTYHYLNWFSKTSIIGWHKVPKARVAGIVVVWLVSLALFRADYLLGVKWLYLLSFMHVVLEFPLNHLSFVGIGKELTARVRSTGAVSRSTPS